MWKSRVVTSIRTILTAKTGILTKEGVESLRFLLYIIGSKDKNVHVVNSHQLISSTVKWSRAILQCSQAVKQ